MQYTYEIIQKLAAKTGVEILRAKDHQVGQKPAADSPQSVNDWIDALRKEASGAGLPLLTHFLAAADMSGFLQNLTFPAVLFAGQDSQVHPLLVYPNDKGQTEGLEVKTQQVLSAERLQAYLPNLTLYTQGPDPAQHGKYIVLTSLPLPGLAGQPTGVKDGKGETFSPTQRLFRLLGTERKDISYIYVYAIVVGLISLILPLGTQAIVSLISGGLVFSSVIVLIGLIILGVMATGGLQIMQITLVEVLQQRIFAKAAFEFAFRLPKMRQDILRQYYPPELMNRFFDVVNIQKSLPKVLVDISGALLQILFGLILLSFYHPFFLAFGLLIGLLIAVIFRFTSPKGLKTSIYESKYKYKLVFWLQEVARSVSSFRLAGETNLHLQKTDDYVNNYLHYRNDHFRVLRTQYVWIVLFKTFITGGLLIVGTLLVVDRQITLGQFVASEIIIVLVVGAVEKLIFSMDIVYDLLTSVDKIGAVTDLPLEKELGSQMPLGHHSNGLQVEARALNYRYPGDTRHALQNIEFVIQPGERMGIVGRPEAGKHTLAKLLAGAINEYEGILLVNAISRRDILTSTLQASTGSNLFSDDLFEGTLLENITLGRSTVNHTNLWWALEQTGLTEFVSRLPEGLHTQVAVEGRGLPVIIRRKIILARAIAPKPRLLVLIDNLFDLPRRERNRLIACLTDRNQPWSLIVLSNETHFLTQCDRVLLLDEGKVVARGTYQELAANSLLQEMLLEEV